MKIDTQSLLDIWARKAYVAYWIVGTATLAAVTALTDGPADDSEEARKMTNKCIDHAKDTSTLARCHAIYDEFRSCAFERNDGESLISGQRIAYCLLQFRKKMLELHPSLAKALGPDSSKHVPQNQFNVLLTTAPHPLEINCHIEPRDNFGTPTSIDKPHIASGAIIQTRYSRALINSTYPPTGRFTFSRDFVAA